MAINTDTTSLKPKVTIQVLKGIHTFEAIPELVEKTKSSNIILIEGIGLHLYNKNIQDLINALLDDNDFVNLLETNPEEKAKYINGFHAEFSWHYRRKSEIYIGLVDKIDCTDFEEVQKYMFGERFKYVDEYTEDLLADRYQLFDRILSEEAAIVNERDEIVAKQTQEIIDKFIRRNWFEGRDEIKVSIIVGELHNTTKELRQRLPEANVYEETYAKYALDRFLASPIGMLVMDPIAKGAKPDPKVVDYFMLDTYLDKSQINYSERVIDVIHTGGTEDFLSSLSTAGLKPIDEYDPVELRKFVDSLIKDGPPE